MRAYSLVGGSRTYTPIKARIAAETAALQRLSGQGARATRILHVELPGMLPTSCAFVSGSPVGSEFQAHDS